MNRRSLTPEDRELWSRVAASAVPLRPAAPWPTAPPAQPASAPRAGPAGAVVAPSFFRVGEAVDHRRSDDLLPGLVEGLGRMPLRMDAGRFDRMTRGKLRPEARLDLHGMTLAEAHPALASFILASRAARRRLVLVITGKGRLSDDLAPMPVRVGRLRHDVPRWLSLPPLADAVLQVAPAHRRHGGEGALYVYLRTP